VRAYLEQQIDLPTLKQAYRLLLREHERSPPRCGRTAEADDANDAATVDGQKVLQLFHIGQTHLASLLQQLIAAERAQERADVRKAIAAVALPNSKLS
jgi:phosphoribosyl 1,2-cyclic phosphodiesterase